MNATDAEPLGAGGIAWSTSKVLLFVFQLLIMLETIFGNLLVVMSVKMEKKLQTPFNYYIVNLAITDMNVGMSVMSLFAIYNLYEYFPFNNFICGYWVWSDYTMTFESVFTLMTIRWAAPQRCVCVCVCVCVCLYLCHICLIWIGMVQIPPMDRISECITEGWLEKDEHYSLIVYILQHLYHRVGTS